MENNVIIGYQCFNLSDITSSSIYQNLVNDESRKKIGQILVKGQKLDDCVNKYTFTFGACDLLCNEIYFKFFLINENKEMMPLFVSESQRV